jgi:hypothetical protein
MVVELMNFIRQVGCCYSVLKIRHRSEDSKRNTRNVQINSTLNVQVK